MIMICSSLRTSAISQAKLVYSQPRNASLFKQSRPKKSSKGSLAIGFLCLVVLFALIPERPQQFASACQKHHSSAACNVW